MTDSSQYMDIAVEDPCSFWFKMFFLVFAILNLVFLFFVFSTGVNQKGLIWGLFSTAAVFATITFVLMIMGFSKMWVGLLYLMMFIFSLLAVYYQYQNNSKNNQTAMAQMITGEVLFSLLSMVCLFKY